jgi:hypothetical protein
MVSMVRAARPGKHCASTVMAGAQSEASARAPATAASAARANPSRSASARSATHAGVQRARAKAAAQETRTLAASTDRAESRRAPLCARRAVRRDAIAGEPAHNSEIFTKVAEDASGKRAARAGEGGGSKWREAPQARRAREEGSTVWSWKASRPSAIGDSPSSEMGSSSSRSGGGAEGEVGMCGRSGGAGAGGDGNDGASVRLAGLDVLDKVVKGGREDYVRPRFGFQALVEQQPVRQVGILGRFAVADARKVGRELLDLDVGADEQGVPVRTVGAMESGGLATGAACGRLGRMRIDDGDGGSSRGDARNRARKVGRVARVARRRRCSRRRRASAGGAAGARESFFGEGWDSGSEGTAAGVRRVATREPCGRSPAARQTDLERGRQVACARRARHGGRGAFRVLDESEDGRGKGDDGRPARGRRAVV